MIKPNVSDCLHYHARSDDYLIFDKDNDKPFAAIVENVRDEGKTVDITVFNCGRTYYRAGVILIQPDETCPETSHCMWPKDLNS